MIISSADKPYSGSESIAGDGPASMEASGLSSSLERSAREATQSLKDASHKAGNLIHERMSALNDVTDKSLATSRNYVREHPLQSTAMAMVAGMLLRRLLSRRSRSR